MSAPLPSWRGSLWSTARAGFFGASFIALIDLSLIPSKHGDLPFGPLASAYLKVMVVYGLIGAIAMVAIGGLIRLFLRLSERTVSFDFFRALHAAGFVYFSIYLTMSYVMNAFSDVSISTHAAIILSSASAAWAVLALTHLCFKKGILPVAFWRPGILLVCLWLGLSFMQARRTSSSDAMLAQAAASPASREQPNILWVVLDTVRPDHLSCYGYSRPTTPHLDRLASESTLYLNAISQSPWSYPSHASMVTGLSPSALGSGTSDWAWLDSRFVTLPEVLQAKGFHTAAVSENAAYFSPKVHLDQGFDAFHITSPYWPHVWVMEYLLFPEILRYVSAIGTERLALKWSQLGKAFTGAVELPEAHDRARITNQRAMQEIRQSIKNDKPFFLMLNYFGAHAPYGKSPYADRFLDRKVMSLSEAHSRVKSDEYAYLRFFLHQSTISPRDQIAYNALYDGDLSYLDERFGELLDFLRAEKIMDNTLVIVTSDHGEYLGEENLFAHSTTLAHRLLHVPLLIRYPKSFAAGRTVSTFVQLQDLFPTVLDILDFDDPRPRAREGESLLKLPPGPRAIVSEVFLTVPLNPHSSMRAVLDKNPGIADEKVYVGLKRSLYLDPYHFLVSRHGERLYNVATDPEETQDLWKSRPNEIRHMRQLLRDWMNRQPDYWGPPILSEQK